MVNTLSKINKHRFKYCLLNKFKFNIYKKPTQIDSITYTLPFQSFFFTQKNLIFEFKFKNLFIDIILL